MRLLRRALRAVVIILFGKILLEIVYQYRWYFPADFSADFLLGRESTFVGWYRAAFYSHIISGPITILLGGFLIVSSERARWQRWHQTLGRVQIMIVLAVVCPSGFVMSHHSFTGPIAGWGFATHSILTGAAATATIVYAMRRQLQQHQQWATRCFVLLCSPLLLRLISGATIMLKVDTNQTYQITAWVSWMVPLVGYELWLRRSMLNRILAGNTRAVRDLA